MPGTTTAVVGTTAAEAAVLEATARALEAGEDPFGDDDDTAVSGAASDDDTDNGGAAEDNGDGDEESAAAAPSSEEGEQGGADKLTEDQLEAVAEDADKPEVPLFKARSPAEYAEARKALLEKRAKAFKDYSEGTIEPEEWSAIDAETLEGLEALTVERTLHTANSQKAQDAWEAALDGVMTAAKAADEVDYSADAAAAKQFDQATALLRADGTQRTPAKLAADAHKMVLALRGITPAQPKPAAAQPRQNGKGPVTLRNVPAAEVANTGGGWMDALNKLTGQEYEAAYDKLTPAQQAQLRGD